MTKTLSFAMILFGVTASACMADDVKREVQFETAAIELPAGQASGTTTLRLTFSAVEALEDGRFVLWGLDGQGTSVALSTVDEGTVELPGNGLPMAIEDIVELVISEEAAGTALPGSLGATVLMRGAYPGGLSFGDFEDHSFLELAGTASIHGNEMNAAMSGLPALPSGYTYGLSLRFGSQGGMEEHAEDGTLFLGSLNEEGHLEMTGDMMLARGSELVLTMESINGREEASDMKIMRGLMLNLDAVEEEASGGGGGH